MPVLKFGKQVESLNTNNNDQVKEHLMVAYAERFGTSNQAENCNTLNNGGSLVYVGMLGKCLKEPYTHVLDLAVAVTAGDEEIDISITPPPAGQPAPRVFLQQGSVLSFQTGLTTFVDLVVATDVYVTSTTPGTPQTVAINAAPAAVPDTATCDYWGMYRLLAPDGFDVNVTTGKESATNLNAGLKTKEIVTSLTLAGNLSTLIEADDPGLWNILHDAATTGGDIFAFISKPGGTYTWGNSQVGNYNRTGQKTSLQKATMEFMFQDTWLSPKMFKYLSAFEQGLVREITRLVGTKTPALVP
jgi:hypothetical protein